MEIKKNKRPHLDLAHHYWERLLRPGDWAIDATCGNGNDTLKLARILQDGRVIGIDIQQEAIDKTEALLKSHEERGRVHLFCQSHAEFPSLAQVNPIKLIVYNLGYLPKGNKQITTLTSSTLQSVRNALELVLTGGEVCITCYPGHEEGRKEEQALLQEIAALPSPIWNVCYHTFPNRNSAPSLILIQKLF